MEMIDDAQNQLVIKSLNTEVGLWRLKVEQLETENQEFQTALEKIRDHDTHNLHYNKGNAYQMAKIAEQALTNRKEE